jgi:hypothetical protein
MLSGKETRIPNDPLGSIRIAEPCHASWDEMAGDERVRHCTLCSLNVYNFAEMSRNDVRELLLRTEGRVCARLYRRADGTLLTRDCPTGFRALQRRASRVAATLIASLLTLPAWAFGGTSCSKPRLKTSGSKVKIAIERVATAQPAVFAGVVRYDGTALPGVTISIRDETTNHQTAALTDANGAFSIAALTDGTYRVEVALAGFTPATIEHLELKTAEVMHATIALQVTAMMGEIITVGGLAPMDYEPGKVTLTQEVLKKLPF